MATTKSRTSSARKSTSQSSSRKRNDGLAARTGRTIRDRPYASAAIAAGTASIVAGIAGLFAMKRSSGKNWSEFGEDLSARASEQIGNAKTKVKDAASSLSDKRHRDGLDPDKSQTEIMEEALTLKQTGAAKSNPSDPVVDSQTKAGAIAY